MRRNSSHAVGGGAATGGFSKPPPAPMSHGVPGRARLHTPDVGGPVIKDRFGSPRERSPSLVGSLPISPSRERSPNPTSQDLHDCSMCLSAYIQSLNTLCGTACRLSQCLSQVASETDVSTSTSATAREVAEVWEGIVRVVGMASAAVKTQNAALLQEYQARSTEGVANRRQDQNKIIAAFLSTFLNLNGQFSALVLDRFSATIQSMTCPAPASPQQGGGGTSPRPSHSASQGPKSPHPQTSLKNLPLFEVAVKEDETAEQSRRVNHGGDSGSPGVTGWSRPPFSSGSCFSLYPPHSNGFEEQPGGWNPEAISRRWSMGATGQEFPPERTATSLSTFSLVTNRRWSVPEANEHDLSSSVDLSYCGPDSEWTSGRGSLASGPGILHVPSRDSSITRSPSHSRSATPDRNTSMLSSEELQDVIDLLSLPITEAECPSTPAPPCSMSEPGLLSPPSPSSLQPPIITLLEEGTTALSHPMILPPNQDDTQSRQRQASLHQQTPPLLQQFHTAGYAAKLQQYSSNPPYNSCCPRAKSPRLVDCKVRTPSGSPGSGNNSAADKPTEGLNPNCSISTPLWPPTGSVPGVTLTECPGGDENPAISPWPEDRHAVIAQMVGNNSNHRASWPASANPHYHSWMTLDDSATIDPNSDNDVMSIVPMVTQYRRHSSDMPATVPNLTASQAAKSSEDVNTASGDVASLSKVNCLNSNLQHLAYLNSLSHSTPSSPKNRFALFSPTTT